MKECACVYRHMESLVEVVVLLNPLGVPGDLLRFAILAIGQSLHLSLKPLSLDLARNCSDGHLEIGIGFPTSHHVSKVEHECVDEFLFYQEANVAHRNYCSVQYKCGFMLKKFRERDLHDKEAFGVRFILHFDLGGGTYLNGV